MSLSNISIERPVLATVMSITIILFGVIGFTYLGVREYPSVDPPIITVSTNYTGANAEVIESQITEPLEESINGISGIRTLTSVSREGRSTITVEFNLSVDLEAAANDVRDRVSRAQYALPPDVQNPIVSKADADSQPIVFLNVQSDTRNILELTDLAVNVFKERLQTISGVSQIQIWGEKLYSMRLWLDPARMDAYKVTPMDVRNALQRENVELPSGRVEGDNTELTIRTIGRLYTEDEFNNLIIREYDGRKIKLSDVGYAELGPENERTVLKRNGVPMVGVVLIPQPGANNIAITDEFYTRVEQIKKDLPGDITTGVGFDVTDYIRDSIDEVQQTIYTAFLLVVFIIFFFLRDWRTTIIPVIVVPISLIGAFFIMYVAGFSINVLTLLAIVLAIGLVVDDAIVVMENIYAKIESGMPPIQAAKVGTKEIFFAVISTTVALASVFLPVIFLEGITGRLFREFGIVIAGCVVISSFVALTLSPMLSSKILKQRDVQPKLYRQTEPFFQWLNAFYAKSLQAFLKIRWFAFVIILACIGGIYAISTQLQSELAPLEDRGSLRVFSSAPEGATFDYMDFFMDKLVNLTQRAIPELDAVISVTSPGFGASSSVNTGFMRVILKDASERKRSQSQIANALSQDVSKLTMARTFISEPQSIGGRRGGLPVQFVIQAQTLDKLKEKLPEFLNTASKQDEFAFVDVNLKFNKPEMQVTIDRERVRTMGVDVQDIAQTMQLAYSGQRFGYFIKEGKQYQVIGQVNRADRDEPLDVKSLKIKNDRGQLISLDNLVNTTEKSSPPQLFRFDRYVSATVSAALAPGYSLAQGITAMEGVANGVLDESFTTSLSGTSRDFKESSDSLLFAFGLAILLIYLVLSAQFESFRDPFIILFTVPLAVTGAVATLWVFGETLNIFSQIGIIMLVGLVTKNGILLVEFANQRKKQGLSVMEAAKDAAKVRFRPILMTSLSTVLGILPLALALGAGSESRVSMGIAIIGGLIFASILTLYVIPAVYTFFSNKTQISK
jgi:multidrug efflux pump